MKRNLPWWLKIAAKLILSRLPFGYSVWQNLGLFRHGAMDKSDYAIKVFETHIRKAGLDGKLQGKTILELGPGDSVASAIIAKTYSAKAILVDSGSFAQAKLLPYLNITEVLTKKGLSPPNTADFKSIEEMLLYCDARYLTEGLNSLKNIQDESVDMIFSQAVLEHIRKEEFLDTLCECLRILKPNGICSHRVDLTDHLGGYLNNLRFTERIWESDFFSSSGFYTNRLRFNQMFDLFSQAGFKIGNFTVSRWETLPTPYHKMSEEFRSIPINDLLVADFDVLLHKI